MVAKAKEELEQEILIKEEEKQKYLSERAPPLNTSGLSLQQLQVNQPQKTFHSSLNKIKTFYPFTVCFVHICIGSLQRAPREGGCGG